MTAAPSPWVARHAGLVPSASPVLDVAAGGGRHTRLFLARGHPVTAVDVDVTRLPRHPRLEVVAADLETGDWPLAGRTFGGVVVTSYLHRPLLPALVAAVAVGGVLLYETFMQGHVGRPSNPDFLLRPGELREAVGDRLDVVAAEEGPMAGPRPAVLQRIAAVRPRASPPARSG